MAASSPGVVRRASAHNVAQVGGARSQFFSSAGQSSALRSACQPGSSSKPTATQRLALVGGSAGAASRGGAGVGGSSGGGGVLQPASTPRIAVTALQSHQGRPMGLLLLEALLALGLLVFIVWWVMFAGRRKGERRDDEPKA